MQTLPGKDPPCPPLPNFPILPSIFFPYIYHHFVVVHYRCAVYSPLDCKLCEGKESILRTDAIQAPAASTQLVIYLTSLS